MTSRSKNLKQWTEDVDSLNIDLRSPCEYQAEDPNHREDTIRDQSRINL